MTKPNDDTVYLRRNVMEALKKISCENGKLLKKERQKWRTSQEKLMICWKSFCRSRVQSESYPRDDLIHRKNERRR